MLDTLLQESQSPQGLSPLPLAFVGDGVYELMVREYLVSQGNCPVKKLHSRRYMDMDQVIEEALALAETELTYEEP